jgi:hypothetical protein
MKSVYSRGFKDRGKFRRSFLDDLFMNVDEIILY